VTTTDEPVVTAVDRALRQPTNHDTDPLLDAIHTARQRALQAEEDLRSLIAYAREFTYPRPYMLRDLADAAGLSISGVRISYDTDDIRHVSELLGRPPTTAPHR
jgi:hypothetical protein